MDAYSVRSPVDYPWTQYLITLLLESVGVYMRHILT